MAIALFTAIPFVFYSCETTPAESCEQQDMNDIMSCGAEKIVEVCCTEGAACVYHFNGKDYPDSSDGLNDLADALGCNYKSSEANEAQRELIIKHLIELMERARYGSYQ